VTDMIYICQGII